MKKLILPMLLAVACLNVHADSMGCNSCCYDPCCSSNCNPCCDPCCGTFEVFGRALWYQPSSCCHDYVVRDTTYGTRLSGATGIVGPVGTEKGVCPDYNWGFKVGASYITCDGCFDVRATYSRLHTSDSQRTDIASEAAALWPTNASANVLALLHSGAGSPAFGGDVLRAPAAFQGATGINAFGRQKVRHEWDAVDVEVASRTMRDCNFFVRSHIGLEWTQIKAKEQNYYQGTLASDTSLGDTVARINSKNYSETWGVGPRVGFDARYHVACGFGITATVGTGLFGGEAKHHEYALGVNSRLLNGVETELSRAQLDVKQNSRCIVFPEFDASLGVDYEWCCGCLRIVGEVGYDFRTYLHVLNDSTYSDQRGAEHACACDPFNMQGLYFGLRLQI